MSLIKAQDKVDDWVRQHELGYFNPFEILARLAEENGELAREISNKYGSKKKKSSEENKRIKDELGDFLFTLICMANSEEVDLGKALEETIRKYNKRDSERWRKNEKIDSLKYWKFHNMLELKSAGNYSDLREIALDVLQRMPQPVGEVCGPISSGGKGSIEENMKYFYILIVIFLVLWRLPLLFLDLGIIPSAILPVIAFFIAYFIVEKLRKRDKIK